VALSSQKALYSETALHPTLTVARNLRYCKCSCRTQRQGRHESAGSTGATDMFGKRANLDNHGPPGPKQRTGEQVPMDQLHNEELRGRRHPKNIPVPQDDEERSRSSAQSKQKQRPPRTSKGNPQGATPTGSEAASSAFTLEELVETNRRITLRLCKQVREQRQQTSWVVLISNDPEAASLRTALTSARKSYLDSAPKRGEGKGQHEDGPLPCYLLSTLVEWIREQCAHAGSQHQAAVDALDTWCEACFPFGNNHRSCAHAFGAKGNRSKVPQGIWVWALSFDYLSEEGLAAHRATARLIERGYASHPAFRIARDNSPTDVLERNMQSMYLGEVGNQRN
jgi:hypothetical protein